jgi:hypothetical protein
MNLDDFEQMDDCIEVIFKFPTYQLYWSRDHARRVFKTLREQLQKNSQIVAFPPPVVLRKQWE